MKIVIFGGSGFIGESLVETLAGVDNIKLTVVSRHAQTKYFTFPQVFWLQSSVTEDHLWEATVKEADWVIDCIGILLPNPFKQQNYQSASIAPAFTLIHFIAKCPKPRFLFISAKKAPLFISPYLKAKRKIEAEMVRFLADRGRIVYPSLVYDQARERNWTTAQLILWASRKPLIRRLVQDALPIKRDDLSREILKILNDESSPLTRREG